MLPEEHLPLELIARQQDLLGADAMAAWRRRLVESAPSTVFRVNTLQASVLSVLGGLRAAGLTPEPLSFRDDCFAVPASQRRALTESAPAAAGEVYIQNPSSMLAPMYLDPRPGEEVLDLAAAPGGKTLVMAVAMDNRGRLAAVERSRPRFFKLRANCAAQGATCVVPYLKDGARVGRLTPERFDRVLLDAPCSAEARIRADEPETYADWGMKRIKRLARLQARLLDSAIRALRPGGRLVYATCTYAPEENEAVIDAALVRWDGVLDVVPPPFEPPVTALPGITSWRGRTYRQGVNHARRIVGEGVWEGFFLAVLEKRRARDDG
ncbi:RsmB/NOP family class I SAM-dependent RNA methyltransferase [Arhodomonas sp. AD133]|uniref:RsmB/NOP family class I SAM-dependent RNA methyltransferase n=1 Tax=Arhodomonas sp. AD133 TaxID=3415009 RepID=UPI003EBECAB5